MNNYFVVLKTIRKDSIGGLGRIRTGDHQVSITDGKHQTVLKACCSA
jgi:hypothetical protein